MPSWKAAIHWRLQNTYPAEVAAKVEKMLEDYLLAYPEDTSRVYVVLRHCVEHLEGKSMRIR